VPPEEVELHAIAQADAAASVTTTNADRRAKRWVASIVISGGFLRESVSVVDLARARTKAPQLQESRRT
jgi:hypothetical protein